nr:MAG TPA: hypothetical protein [Herelleviridae sp.]
MLRHRLMFPICQLLFSKFNELFLGYRFLCHICILLQGVITIVSDFCLRDIILSPV